MENLYIQVLRYGRDNEQVRFEDLVEHLQKMDVSISLHHTRLNHIFSSSFETYDGKTVNKNNHQFSFLRTEALAYLLSFESLEQAKRDSRNAKNLAMWSIIISGIMAAISIGLQMIDSITR